MPGHALFSHVLVIKIDTLQPALSHSIAPGFNTLILKAFLLAFRPLSRRKLWLNPAATAASFPVQVCPWLALALLATATTETMLEHLRIQSILRVNKKGIYFSSDSSDT